MEWWQVYLLFKLTAIQGLFIATTVVCSIGVVIGIIWKIVNIVDANSEHLSHNKVAEKQAPMVKAYLRRFVPALIIALLLSVAMPSTDSMLKMAAVKYGVDIVTTDKTIKNTGENVLQSIENMSKVLEQKTRKMVKE